MRIALSSITLVLATITVLAGKTLAFPPLAFAALIGAIGAELAAVRLPYFGTVSFGLLVYLPVACSSTLGPATAVLVATIALAIREATVFSGAARFLDEVMLELLPLSLAAIIPTVLPPSEQPLLSWLAVGLAFITTRHVGVQLASSSLETEQKKIVSRLQTNTSDIRWGVLGASLIAVPLLNLQPLLLLTLVPIVLSFRKAAIHAYAWLDSTDKKRLRDVAGRLSKSLLSAEGKIQNLSSSLQSTESERDLLLSFSQDTAACRSLSELLVLLERRCGALALGTGVELALRLPDGWQRVSRSGQGKISAEMLAQDQLSQGVKRCWKNNAFCFSQKSQRAYHPMPGMGVFSYRRADRAARDIRQETAELFSAQVALASLSALRFEQLDGARAEVARWNESLSLRNKRLVSLTEELRVLSGSESLEDASSLLPEILPNLLGGKLLGIRLRSPKGVLFQWEQDEPGSPNQKRSLEVGSDHHLEVSAEVRSTESESDDIQAVGLQCVAEILQQLILQRSLRIALQQLRESEGQLIQSAKLAAVGQLSAGLAHEINNPLGSIRLAIEMTLKKEQLSDLNQNLLDKALKGVERAQNITSSLLSYSRAGDKGRLKTDAAELVQEACGLLESALKLRNITLKVESESSGQVKVNLQEIQQVITNLILNAADSADMQRAPLIEVRSKLVGTNLEIEVHDNGEGVPPEVEDKIFDPFFTTKPVGKGTGLGLSVSRSLTEAHGGSLSCKGSELLDGACFTLCLPVH